MKTYSLLFICLVFISFNSRCVGSRLTVGSELETFVSLRLDTSDHEWVYTHSIQEDEYIPGNVLATIGNGLYTVDPYGEATLLAGSLQTEGYVNGYGSTARFNKTAGMLQMYNGTEVIISDYFNFCLRKLVRSTNEVTSFAGRCGVKNYDYVLNQDVCLPITNGFLKEATFCNPVRMRYVESEDKIILMHIAKDETYIRSIDLSTSYVSTLFYNLTYIARDFYIEEDNSYTLSIEPGLINIDFTTGVSKWLAGCGNSSFPGECYTSESIQAISMIHPHGIVKRDGIYFVSDMFGRDVYMVNVEDGLYARLCRSGDRQLFWLTEPTGIAIIGEYLYIGETILPETYSYTRTQSVFIRRIKLSITKYYDSYQRGLLFRMRPETTTETTTKDWFGKKTKMMNTDWEKYLTTAYYNDYVEEKDTGSGSSPIIFSVIGGVAFLIAIVLLRCCIRRAALKPRILITHNKDIGYQRFPRPAEKGMNFSPNLSCGTTPPAYTEKSQQSVVIDPLPILPTPAAEKASLPARA